MALFSKKAAADPIAELQTRLVAARPRRDDVAARLAAAETAAVERRRTVEALAADGGSDADLDVAEAELRAREDRARTLSSALMQVDSDVAALEAQLAAAVEQRERDTCATALEEMAAKIEKAFPKHVAATTELVNAIKSSVVSIPETKQLADHLITSENQIGEAVTLVISELKTGAAGIRDGSRRFRTEGPTSPVVAPPVPIATVRAYTLDRAVRWTQDGELRTAGKFSTVDLPADLLPIAREHNLADDWGSDRAAKYRATMGQFFDRPLDGPELVNLDRLAEQDVAGEAIMDAAE